MFPPPAGRTDRETTAHRLDEVLGAYLEAVESGRAPNRQEFLAAHPDLAGDLEAFLADQDRFDALMAPLSSHGGRSRTVAGPEAQPGQILGHYELVEEIARGGMGVVYKARQYLGDGNPRPYRVVALKMISDGSGSSSADVQRFRLEATAVAHLDHPNIVPLYEIGEHEMDAGRLRIPYFSMKLVEGGSLARQVGRFKDKPEAAARLLLGVARAIEYAHQRGILHRDLKPANILLEGRLDGPPDQWQALVADFGLAKRLQPAEPASGFFAANTVPPTQQGAIVGTPSYMAPEQARGSAPVTTAADVYSLGAILYELLTGRPPFRTATGLGTLLEALERDPVPPSKHCPEVGRDLETICLKCLQKEPGQRYASAAALADDLQRFLNGEPIHARPVGRGERFVRWCRRQPLLAALSAAVVLAVTVGVPLLVWQWQRAEKLLVQATGSRLEAETHAAEANRQRGRAEKHAAEADEGFREAHDAVKKFCIELSEHRLSSIPGMQPLRKELLEAGLKYLLKFAARRDGDPKLRNELADTHFRIAFLTNILGPGKDALALYRQALALYRALQSDPGKQADPRLMIARTLANMGNLFEKLNRPDEVDRSIGEALAILEELARERPDDWQVLHSLAYTLNNQSNRSQNAGRRRAALGLTLRAGAILRRLADRQPNRDDFRRDVALNHSREGTLRQVLGEADRALQAYQEACRGLEKLAARSDDPTTTLDLARTYRHISTVTRDRGQRAEALAALTKSRELCEQLARTAAAYLASGQPDRALSLYEQTLATHRKLEADHPGILSVRLGLAVACHNVGNVYRGRNRPADALRAYQEARGLFEKVLARDPHNAGHLDHLAGTINNLADVLQKLDRHEEALKAFEEAVRTQKEALGLAPGKKAVRQNLSMYLGNLARAHRLAKRPDRAVAVTLEQRKLWAGNAVELYGRVRAFLLAAEAANKDAPDQRKAYGLALETLDLALQAGYRDFDNLRKNPTLAALRARPEFQTMLQAFEGKHR